MSRADYLVLGDLHFPFHAKSTFPFIKRIIKYYRPKSVISIGDEADFHRGSFHQSSTKMPGASQEYWEARDCMQELAKIFPKLTILESNHGSLPFRKAHAHGLADEMFKGYNDLWGVPKTWKWVFDHTIKLTNGQHCYLHHGKTSNVLKLSQSLGMSAIQGHYHSLFGVQYWRSPLATHFAAQTGCLIDLKSDAFSYGRAGMKRPILGSLIIKGSQAIPIPMVLDKKLNWIGRLI